MKKWTRMAGTFAVAAALVALPACDRDSGDNGHGELASLQVIDRGQTAQPVVATWTAAGGWEGSLPSISLSSSNQRVSIGFRAFEADGDEITLEEGGEYEMRYALATGAPQGILDMDIEAELFHGDHVHIYGAAVGTTQVRFLFWHGDHADRETQAINISVVE